MMSGKQKNRPSCLTWHPIKAICIPIRLGKFLCRFFSKQWMQLLIHPSQVGCCPVALQEKLQASTSEGEHELVMQILGKYLQFHFTEMCFERNMLIISSTNKCKENLQNYVFLKFNF